MQHEEPTKRLVERTVSTSEESLIAPNRPRVTHGFTRELYSWFRKEEHTETESGGTRAGDAPDTIGEEEGEE
jgi:hypothetical protein